MKLKAIKARTIFLFSISLKKKSIRKMKVVDNNFKCRKLVAKLAKKK